MSCQDLRNTEKLITKQVTTKAVGIKGNSWRARETAVIIENYTRKYRLLGKVYNTKLTLEVLFTSG